MFALLSALASIGVLFGRFRSDFEGCEGEVGGRWIYINRGTNSPDKQYKLIYVLVKPTC